MQNSAAEKYCRTLDHFRFARSFYRAGSWQYQDYTASMARAASALITMATEGK